MNDDVLQRNIRQTVASLGLSLKGRTVLTEAASGPYCVAPLNAAMAGAHFIAFGKSTRHGSVEEVFAHLEQRLRACGVDDCTLTDSLTPEVIGAADIITNSGHLRPLDADKLRHTKPGAVVSLMYEAWELRDSDVDIKACKNRKIPVGGLNERHPAVGVFEYLGDMAAVLIERGGLTVRDEKIVLLCNNEFGPYIAKTLCAKGVRLGVIATQTHRERYPADAAWLSDTPGRLNDHDFRDASAVVFTAYPFDQVWISPHGPYPVTFFQEHFPRAVIMRFAGDIDTAALDTAGIRYFPQDVTSGHMGVLPSDVGYEPVIRLQAGGLRVGQAMLEDSFDVNGQSIGGIITT